VDAALAPITLVAPPPAPNAPPPGAYYAWIRDVRSGDTVAGLPPDLPLAYAPIAFVPVDDTSIAVESTAPDE
jgi:hypothetical protein